MQPLLEPEKFYHIYNHANGKENLFYNEGNYDFFLRKYTEHLHSVLETYAYCLLPNHFHLLVRIRNENVIKEKMKLGKKLPNLESTKFVSKQFSNFFSAYTQALNIQQSRMGSLFMPNFKRKEVNSPDYLLQLIHYIHFNPIKHNLVLDIHHWKYTSFHSFFSQNPTKLSRENVITLFGDQKEFELYHQKPLIWEDLDML